MIFKYTALQVLVTLRVETKMTVAHSFNRQVRHYSSNADLRYMMPFSHCTFLFFYLLFFWCVGGGGGGSEDDNYN